MAALHDLLDAQEWHTRAACATYDPDLWWIEDPHDSGRNIALDVCASCPVQRECLEHALALPERDGIWGGKLPHERKRMAYHRRAVA